LYAEDNNKFQVYISVSQFSDPACAPTADIAVDLVIYPFLALICFIFSAISALAPRAINASTTHYDVNNGIEGSTPFCSSHVIILFSDIGFLMGVGFLLLAIANLTQMKLGTFSCGSSFTWAVVVGLFIFTYLSLFLFIVSSISDYKKARVRGGIGCEIICHFVLLLVVHVKTTLVVLIQVSCS
jgi:hypothetical protein